MDKTTDLKICSYNCRSLKSSVYDVIQMCEKHDIVCLQEHWLLPSELGMLSELHADFMGLATVLLIYPQTY